uniref:Uncharacterized protein n=1 Tax=Arundo donax TaxID=35708 RepID=A0A0A8YXX5_ARUDO
MAIRNPCRPSPLRLAVVRWAPRCRRRSRRPLPAAYPEPAICPILQVAPPSSSHWRRHLPVARLPWPGWG